MTLFAVTVSFLLTFLLDWRSYAMLTISLLMATVVVRTPLKFALKGLSAAIVISLFTLVLHLLFGTRSGEIATRVFGLSVDSGALTTGLLYCWRIGLFMALAAIFVAAVSPYDLSLLLRRLLRKALPSRKLSESVALAVSVGIRFVPLMLAQAETVTLAQRARGASFSSRSFRNFKEYAALLVPLLMITARRSQTLADALTARYWGLGRVGETLRQFKLRGE